MKKRFLIFTLIFAMLLPNFLIGVSAEDTMSGQIVVEKVSTLAGRQVEVRVSIKNNPGIAYLELTPDLPVGIELIEVKNGALISDFEAGTQYVWNTDTDVTSDGVLMSFVFNVPAEAIQGDYNIGMIFRGCYNAAEEEVPLYVVNRKVSVVPYIYGDANDDGTVDGKDLVRLKKYIAAYDYDTGISSVEVGLGVDATGDRIIDGKDLVRIKKYIAAYDYENGTSDVVMGPEDGSGAILPLESDYVSFDENDIVKIDASGNLVVNAVIASSGDSMEIKVGYVNDVAVGLQMKAWLEANGYSIESATKANLKTALKESGMDKVLYWPLYVSTFRSNGTFSLESVEITDGLGLMDGIIVATENQTLGYSNLPAKGCVVISSGDLSVTVKAKYLLKAGESVDDLLGYAVKAWTLDNWETVICVKRCATDVLYNYGTTQTDMTYVQMGYAPNVTYRTNMIKLKGKNYNWGTEHVASANQFVAYELSAMTYSYETIKDHHYDTDGNIVDSNTGEILIYKLDGEYYVNTSSSGAVQTLRKATFAEIEAAKTTVYTADGSAQTYSTYNCYTEIANGQSDKVWNNKFCELKVFDPDNDGDWDYGIFKPYSIGVYGTASSMSGSSNAYVTDFDKNTTSTTTGKSLIAIDGIRLPAYANTTARAGALVDAITFIGGKPNAGDTVLYNYNPYTGVFEVIENLGTYKIGNVTELNGTGSYAVIDGERYAYNLTESNLRGWSSSDLNLSLIQTLIADRTYTLGYLAVGGYLLETSKINPYGYTSFAAFTWPDMVKVDSDGNLYVKAFIDATGVKKEIKISDVENFRVGAAMYDWLKNNGYVTGNSYWVGSTASTVTKSVLMNALAYAQDVAGRMVLPSNIYAARLNADGTYSLVPFTPETSYDPVTNKFDKDDVNIVDNMNERTITLNYGINNAAYVTSVKGEDKLIATSGKFETTADTTYIFVGKDDIRTFKGVAPNGAKIHLESHGTVLMNATADCVFVVNKYVAVESLYEGWNTTATHTNDYVFYAVTKDTKVSLTSANAANQTTLTVTGLYNVFTDEVQDLVVTGDHATLTYPIYVAINDKWPLNDVSTSAANLILFSAKEKRFEMGDHVFDEFEAYFREKYAYNSATVYTNAKLGNLNNANNLVMDGMSVMVQSYALKTFWGYDGSLEVVDGVNVKRDFNDRYDPDNERAFIYMDAAGNAYGYVFAPGMAK